MQGMSWSAMTAAARELNRRSKRLTRYEDPMSAEDDYYRFEHRNE